MTHHRILADLSRIARTATSTVLHDSLAIAGDHKAHFDITVNGDFDQFDRKPIEIISPSVLCALHFFASGSYQRALATGHCVSQQALSDSGYALKPWLLLTPITGAPPGSREYRYTKVHAKTRNRIERCCFIKFIFYKGLCKVDEGMVRDMNAQNRQLQEIILQVLSRGIDLLEGFVQNR
ncbi:hypothetical protein EVAR_8652_1 [Eumeta japonica]|uniref:Uncharacterized protein n=1 Tax=Eumeta variegata TaxID=151549 RepID=A0A4C1TV99_EUMVA|nr:hypothetical protein EVAR_8652_1 [Eumeta japonica]